MGLEIRRIFAKSKLASLIAVLLLCTTVIAPAAADPRLHGQGRLWQVTRGDAAPSHVFGTMHVTRWTCFSIRRAKKSPNVSGLRVRITLT